MHATASLTTKETPAAGPKTARPGPQHPRFEMNSVEKAGQGACPYAVSDTLVFDWKTVAGCGQVCGSLAAARDAASAA